MTQLTAERLRALLDYDQTCGTFVWRARSQDEFSVDGAADRWNGRYAGLTAGSKDKDGYVLIRVLTRRYKAHRLAFLHVTGQWPELDVDHMNGNKADNSWRNLRSVSRSMNCQNLRSARADNATGLLGVSTRSDIKKFVAQISVDGVKRSLGYFDTPEQAHDAYVEAKRNFHEGCTL